MRRQSFFPKAIVPWKALGSFACWVMITSDIGDLAFDEHGKLPVTLEAAGAQTLPSVGDGADVQFQAWELNLLRDLCHCRPTPCFHSRLKCLASQCKFSAYLFKFQRIKDYG